MLMNHLILLYILINTLFVFIKMENAERLNILIILILIYILVLYYIELYLKSQI